MKMLEGNNDTWGVLEVDRCILDIGEIQVSEI